MPSSGAIGIGFAEVLSLSENHSSESPTSECSKSDFPDSPMSVKDESVTAVQDDNKKHQSHEPKDSPKAKIDQPHRAHMNKVLSPRAAKVGSIDTAAPFESVKEAVSKFGGTANWRSRRTQSMESSRFEKLDKTLATHDLDSTQRLIEELKLKLEKAQREESQAKQDSELARLRVQQMERDIANEASLAAKAQLEVEKARLQEELQALREEYNSMVTEKTENLSVKDLKSKLEASSALLHDLKAELAAYMESKSRPDSNEEQTKELEAVKLNIEKATAEVNCLKAASISLKSEIEQEKSILNTIRLKEELASAAVASLQAELDKTRAEIAALKIKENESREKMAELPKKLQEIEEEADQAKSLVQEAHMELSKAKDEVEEAKAKASTMENKLLAAQKEVQAAKASERLAVAAIKALQGSESSGSVSDEDSPSHVALSVQEYHELATKAYEAEEQANLRVAAANSQIEAAKESELRSLEKLEEVNQELAARNESLKIATEKAENAREGKLGVEQELREWRTEQAQQRKTDEPSNNTETGSCPDASSKKKKKKKLLPRVAMFFSKRKTHPSKSH